MRIVWLLGLTTGCGYISDAKYDLRLDPDQDGVSIEEDCDNEDPNLGLKRTFYADTDGDGFGNPDALIEACFLPEGASENSLDCDRGSKVYISWIFRQHDKKKLKTLCSM